jgi:hypothetical protein
MAYNLSICQLGDRAAVQHLHTSHVGHARWAWFAWGFTTISGWQMTPENLNLIERLSKALVKLTNAASLNLGADCLIHAQLAQRLMHDHGIASRFVVGAAAWRVGSGDSDVITHMPSSVPVLQGGKLAIGYHAWLQIGDTIVDFSTHTLQRKGRELDALDGGTTNVVWCPDYLVVNARETKTFREVAQAPAEGVSFYAEIPGLLDMMVGRGLVTDQPDEYDLSMLRLVFASPDATVLGPCSNPAE